MDSGELPKTTGVRTDLLDVIAQPPDVGLAGCRSLLSFVLCLLHTIQLIFFFSLFILRYFLLLFHLLYQNFLASLGTMDTLEEMFLTFKDDFST